MQDYYLTTRNWLVKGKVLLLTTLMVLCVTAGYAQTRTVTGTVTGASGEPLVGASVLVKGTQQGALTNSDGAFSVEVGPNDNILAISYLGFNTQEISIDGQSNLSINLSENTSYLDEVVVVAYGTQRKETVTGAVAGVKGVELVKSPAVDLSNSLSGRIPGLVVINTNGEPGNNDTRITIRGLNTLGNSSPLIVIDGIPDRDGGLRRLSPQDIESISVLKDASAAIYGARAANGAILVTTKRGKSGKPTVTYDMNFGWSQPTVIPEMSSAVEYANIMNELPIYQSVPVGEWDAAWQSVKTTGTYTSPTPGVPTINANFSPEAVRLHGEGSDPWGYPDTDWFDDAFRDWSPQNRHNLQISGGSPNFRYLASLGYLHQDAIYNNSATFYDQYSARINVDADVNEYIKTQVGVVLRREDRNFPTIGSGAIFRMLMRGRPTEPEVWPDGRPGPDIENGENPYVVTTNATGYDRQPTDYIQTNASVEISNPWIKGLSLTLMGSIDYRRDERKLWQTPWELYFWDRQTFEADGVTPFLTSAVRSPIKDPRLTQSSRSQLNINQTALLKYDFNIGEDHTFGLMAGVTRETFEGSNFLAFRRNFISPAVDQIFAGGSEEQNTDGGAFERARLGYYGRAQYNYKDKYLAEFIWRYDGSYIFPESDRFGFFPGVLAGWNISNEPFFNVKGIDFLKLRASYGEMGNDQVFFNDELQEFAYLSTFGFGQYPIGGVVVTTLNEALLANPNFTWERANNTNIGLDATLFRGQIDLTLEYFSNTRDQILIQKTGSTPASSGINSLLPPVNAGEVKNSGFEFNVAWNGTVGDKGRFRIGLNGGQARNEVIFLDEVPGIPDYQKLEGKPIGAYLVYESDGVFRNQEEISANTIDYSGVTGQLLPGDMKFKDLNGDGVIDADDQTRIENSITPNFNFGGTVSFTWDAFDFSALFQGATGAFARFQTESGDIGNFLKYNHDNRWSIENPSSEHPRLASRGDTYYTGGNFGNNTYFLFSKDFIRLKNIELGYTLPNSIMEKVKIANLRIYVNALNLVTFADQDIFDPEVEDGNGQYYPQNRVINTGLSVTF
ncbi:MAG: TonB-dependent receptor [Bacteroidota bacterium]